MHVTGPFNLGTLSKSGRIIGKVIPGGQGALKGLIGGISPRAIQEQYTDVAFISPDGNKNALLLIEERYPDNNQTRSVDGDTIFGFSCSVSPETDMETLGWDLHLAGVPFQYGDPGMDGSVYSQDCISHSLYLTDPDGRVIELKPGEETMGDSFIKGLDTITIHTTYPEKSAMFYLELGLFLEKTDLKKVPDKEYLWITNNEGDRIILLYGLKKPDGTPVESGGYGLDHYALSGIICKAGENHSAVDISMEPGAPDMKTQSTYISDTDGYWIECLYY